MQPPPPGLGILRLVNWLFLAFGSVSDTRVSLAPSSMIYQQQKQWLYILLQFYSET